MTADDSLYEMACLAAEQAYVPYCGFQVGAAVRFAGGEIFSGANIDNASYPVTGCAERSAISAGVSRGLRRIDAVAVHARADSVSPCGACRQLIAEFATDDCVVTFPWESKVITVPFRYLLPYSFRFDGPNR